ncbi:MAG TPA: M13 family metallopeptidase [Bryobacteraceae bacterium]|nr:M13 family metallopeptidase [Bryobacteraceae bacterium]
MRLLLRLCPGLGLAAAAAFAQKAPGFDLGAINRSVDPCANFYQYACGGWMAANPIPADQSQWGRFAELQDRNRIVLHNILESVSANKPGRTALEQKIGDYYSSCMDEKAIEQAALGAIKPDLDRIAALADRKELTGLITHLFREGSAYFFTWSPEMDPKDSTQVIANLDQGGLGLPDRDYYLKTDDKSVELRNQYLAHIAKIFTLLGMPQAEADAKAKVLMAIETELAEGSLDRVSRRDPEKIYHKLKIAELAALAPAFDWRAFLTGLGMNGLGAPPIENVDVAVPPFMQTFNAVITGRSLDDLKAYLTYHLVIADAAVLPQAFDQESFNFFGKILSGAKELRARWKRCVDQTDSQLPDALGKSFIDKTLGEQGKRRMTQMVAELEKMLERDLQQIDWMTPATKVQAVHKLHAILNKIGDKAHWLDYSNVRIVRGDALGNLTRTNEFEVQRQLAKIGKPWDKTDWQMSQPTVNAYYDAQENDVNFPAGILQPPFYDNKMDDAVNYGGIGAVIGHELTHGFDDQGRQYDAEGNLRDWWTPEDAKAFDQRTQCLVDQYSGYTAVDDIKLNGKLTLGENTADNGGLRIAYMALIDSLGGKTPRKTGGFTADQRFFVGWAQVWCTNTRDETARVRAQVDPHSPAEFRVNGVVSNMPEFQKAFACRQGQAMVRYPACRVW